VKQFEIIGQEQTRIPGMDIGHISYHEFVSFTLIAARGCLIRTTRFRDLAVKHNGCEIVTGSIAWFHQVRGLGYIRPDDGTRFVLFRISALPDADASVVAVGQRFEFDMDERCGTRGAINLRAIQT
jgi:cold shock CspA family protein